MQTQTEHEQLCRHRGASYGVTPSCEALLSSSKNNQICSSAAVTPVIVQMDVFPQPQGEFNLTQSHGAWSTNRTLAELHANFK